MWTDVFFFCMRTSVCVYVHNLENTDTFQVIYTVVCLTEGWETSIFTDKFFIVTYLL